MEDGKEGWLAIEDVLPTNDFRLRLQTARLRLCGRPRRMAITGSIQGPFLHC